MEELKRLRNSRKGYWTHLKSLLLKANDTIECHANSPAECNIPVLTDLHRQLQRKDDILSGLDSQIVGLIENEERISTKRKRSKHLFQLQSLRLHSS